ncbi:Mitogen-activated protein kinase 14 [Geodia barretti]|uniref:mitogen-activated protein kinase n=2 Tax=Geodia barretti TaxID=519541 RepID=A0AA35QWG1_GEOBA|nr:Mitogen-activated protein kinase 14 [Geodia barretti]
MDGKGTTPRPKDGFYETDSGGGEWVVPQRYQDLQPLGIGTFGTVCSATDTKEERAVAIKKLASPFQGVVHAKRCYREIKLLTHMKHENVVSLYDVFTPTEEYPDFNDVYLVMELMSSDLYKTLKSQKLTNDQVRFQMYQVLRGLKYVHSSGVIHRDIKPSNIGVSADNEIKLLDFGLARAKAEIMTGYVTTRHCRAPEIMLNWMQYTQKVDMWSVGCVMAEMLTGQILFPGSDYSEHIKRIVEFVGTPDDAYMQGITNTSARDYLSSLPSYPKKDFEAFERFFVGADPNAVDLLLRLLDMDPDKRPTAAEALDHPYLAKYHDPEDEPECDRQYDDSFENMEVDVEGWRKLVFYEIKSFVPLHVKRNEQ